MDTEETLFDTPELSSSCSEHVYLEMKADWRTTRENTSLIIPQVSKLHEKSTPEQSF